MSRDYIGLNWITGIMEAVVRFKAKLGEWGIQFTWVCMKMLSVLQKDHKLYILSSHKGFNMNLPKNHVF